MFAAAATPGPALDPHGVAERTYGFFTQVDRTFVTACFRVRSHPKHRALEEVVVTGDW
jgi:hypothetical protein